MLMLNEIDLWSHLHSWWWDHMDKPIPRVVVTGNFATPYKTLAVVDSALPQYKLWTANAHPPLPDRDGVTYETVFIGPAMRNHPRTVYYPMRLALAPRMFKNETPPDIVVIHTTPVDRITGKVSLGTEVNVLPAAIEAVRARGGLVIAQVNHRMPYTYGDGELDPDVIDFGIEVNVDLMSPKVCEPTEVDRAIAANLLPLIPDGAYLQGGIGPVVDTVLSLLAEGTNHYRVFSEMFGDWAMRLAKAGLLKPPFIASFAFGSQEFYRWLDHNPFILMKRTEYTNNPAIIAIHPKTISVNTASEVDLFGQANGCYIKGTFWSGLGGQPDYVEGASRSDGGLAIIALAAMHPKAKVSTIVPRLHGPATSFQPSYVVTEYGAAKIAGESAQHQAENLLNAAHPLVRLALHRLLKDPHMFDALEMR